MNEEKIFITIKEEIAKAARKEKMVTVHTLMLKYAGQLTHLSSREFCEKAELPISFQTEFSKMRNLSDNLRKGTFISGGDGLPEQIFSIVKTGDIVLSKSILTSVLDELDLQMNKKDDQFIRLFHANKESIYYCVSSNENDLPNEELPPNKPINVKISPNHELIMMGSGVVYATLLKV